MNGYICLWRGKRIEVYAETLFKAQCKAAELLKVKPKKRHEITVVLCETENGPVVHKPQDIVG